MQDGLLRLVAAALCFSAVGADSPPTDSPALHQPELIDPIHQLPAADDLVEVHRGEGGRGLLRLFGSIILVAVVVNVYCKLRMRSLRRVFKLGTEKQEQCSKRG